MRTKKIKNKNWGAKTDLSGFFKKIDEKKTKRQSKEIEKIIDSIKEDNYEQISRDEKSKNSD